jgi:hypothetical protein
MLGYDFETVSFRIPLGGDVELKIFARLRLKSCLEPD